MFGHDVAAGDAPDQVVGVVKGDDGKLRQLELREAPHDLIERRLGRDARHVAHAFGKRSRGLHRGCSAAGWS